MIVFKNFEIGNYLNLFLLCLIFLFALVIESNAKVPDIVLSMQKAVVTITTTEHDNRKSFGSGFIVRTDDATKTYIITNAHVIPDNLNSKIKLEVKTNDGKLLNKIKILVKNNSEDIAVLTAEDFTVDSIWMVSSDGVKQGDDVYVIGSPFGLEATVSAGIVSSLRAKNNILQITAPISSGSSGSPVLNVHGEAIGLATLLVKDGQNINFAIPSDTIIRVFGDKIHIKTMKDLRDEKLAYKDNDDLITPKPTNKIASKRDNYIINKIIFDKLFWTKFRWNKSNMSKIENSVDFDKQFALKKEDADKYTSNMFKDDKVLKRNSLLFEYKRSKFYYDYEERMNKNSHKNR